MSKIYRMVKVAKQEAAKSEHAYKLGAVVFKHGKIIAKGYNKVNRGVSTNYGHWAGSLHAELAAIISARTNLEGSSLVVARSTGNLARPCKYCMAAIKEAGIKYIYYTTSQGVDKEKVM